VREKVNKLLPFALVLVFALSRWPGVLPQNFSAAYALAFCGGLYFSRRMAWWLPMGTLLVTDVLLNMLYYDVPPLNGYMMIVLAGFALIVGLGRCFKPHMHFLKLLGGGLIGAVVFYVVSNTASWFYDPGYAKTLAGWLQALTTGLPGYPPTWEFFRNTLLSGGLFTSLFVGAMKLTAESPQEKEAGRRDEAPEGEGDQQPEEAKA
jgi:hypothetical protein